MTKFQIYDRRLNVLPSVIQANSWEEMIEWANSHGMQVQKLRTEWDGEKAAVLGIDEPVKSYANCVHMMGIRAILTENGE